METIIPKVGLRFFHRRVLDTAKFDGKTPQAYQVTRIANEQKQAGKVAMA